MSYPALKIEKTQEVARAIAEVIADGGDPLAVVPESEVRIEFRDGADYDRSGVERASGDLRTEFLPGVSDEGLVGLPQGERTLLEARMAGPVNEVLREHEVACLQDPDFWRYLALFPFRWYTLAREPKFEPQAYGGRVPIDSDGGGPNQKFRKTDLKKQAIFRMFLWGKSARDESQPEGSNLVYERATKLSDGVGGPSVIDVWHSHIVRPQIGHLGRIPHAFIDVVSTDPKPNTNEARELAKLLTRIKHTVVLDQLDYEAARTLVEEQLEFARQRVADSEADKKKASA
jgi:hypothetical protein